MLEINNKQLCESCFEQVDGDGKCSNCGYEKAAYTPDPMVLPIGTKLANKIIIGRVMGKGGFGITYLGYDIRMDKVIAVKEYFPNGVAYRTPNSPEISIINTKAAEAFENGAQKFYTEAEMVAQFNGNPNIVSVYDYFRANGTVYLVMEFIHGVTLKKYTKRHGKLSDSQVLYIMNKVTDALIITHSAGVLHRDISPDNIMICSDKKIKLIDFGAAREIAEDGSSNLTVVMKPGYTPIEQYTKNGRQGAWTDIYSLGVSVYYALTGVVIDDPYARIYEGDDEFVENRRHINADIWRIIKKCTMVEAKDRYRQATELKSELRSVSAPIKAEAIILSDEDFIEKPESEPVPEPTSEPTSEPASETVAATIELTQMVEPASESDFEPADAEIELTQMVEQAAEQAPEELDEQVTEPEESEESEAELKPQKGQRKYVGAAICALLVVLIAAAGIWGKISHLKNDDTPTDPLVTQNSSKNPAKTTAENNNDTPEPLHISMDTEYKSGVWECGDSARFKVFKLRNFKGDVKVTLDIEKVRVDPFDDSDTYFSGVDICDSSYTPVNTWAYNVGKSGKNAYLIFGDHDKFVFVIPRETLDSMQGKTIMLQSSNIIVKGATFEDYNPDDDKISPDAKIIQLDEEYHKDYVAAKIPKSDLQSFDGDVKVTLELDYSVIDNDEVADNDELVVSAICFMSGNQYLTNIKAVNSGPFCSSNPHTDMYHYTLGEFDCPNTFTFTLTKEQIDALDAEGLGFSQQNVWVKSATLERADD